LLPYTVGLEVMQFNWRLCTYDTPLIRKTDASGWTYGMREE
jgi:hypothetical protein